MMNLNAKLLKISTMYVKNSSNNTLIFQTVFRADLHFQYVKSGENVAEGLAWTVWRTGITMPMTNQ